MNKKIILWLACTLFLTAAGCRFNSDSTSVTLGDIIVTTQVKSDNSPVAEVTTILDTAQRIYVAVQLLGAKRGDQVTLTWKYLPKDQIIATEQFIGKRSSERPFEFWGGTSPADSWLASTVVLQDVSWPTGDYSVAVQLNNQETRTIGFSVVVEQDLDNSIKRSYVKNVWLSTKINSANQAISPTTQFSITDPNIYAVVLIEDAPANTKLVASWKLLETGQVLSRFATDLLDSQYIPFLLNLEQVGKTKWAKGNYTFNLSVDNVLVVTKNFQIQ